MLGRGGIHRRSARAASRGISTASSRGRSSSRNQAGMIRTLIARYRMSPKYKIEWYQTVTGDAPVHRWLTQELSEEACELLGAALLEILQADGPDVCETRFGRQLGDGVFEFRLDGDPQPWIDEARIRRGKLPRALATKAPGSSTAFSAMPTATRSSCSSAPTTRARTSRRSAREKKSPSRRRASKTGSGRG